MSSIGVAKMLSTKHSFASRSWIYDWRELTSQFDEKKCSKVLNSIAQKYSALTKSWCMSLNSEWICRIYLSAKMVMNSTLLLNALEYTEEKNVRVVSAYLQYYAALSAVRCIVYTLPDVDWEDGKLIEVSHNRAINIALDYVSKFDFNKAQTLKNVILKLKACRELITYRAPTSGDYTIENGLEIDIKEICTLLVEVAQFNSEIIEASIRKNASKDAFHFDVIYMKKLCVINIGDFKFFDNEDAYRLGYLKRKWPLAPNILHIMTEGHTEDFFGAWDSIEDEPSPDIFDAGAPVDWQTIFDIP